MLRLFKGLSWCAAEYAKRKQDAYVTCEYKIDVDQESHASQRLLYTFCRPEIGYRIFIMHSFLIM